MADTINRRVYDVIYECALHGVPAARLLELVTLLPKDASHFNILALLGFRADAEQVIDYFESVIAADELVICQRAVQTWPQSVMQQSFPEAYRLQKVYLDKIARMRG